MSMFGGLADAIGGMFGGGRGSGRGDGRDAGRSSGISGGFQGRSNVSAAEVSAAAAESSRGGFFGFTPGPGPGAADGGMAGYVGPGEGRAEIAKGERATEPAEPAAPAVEPGDVKGGRPGEEGTGAGAVTRARRLGLASTIATTPGGLLAGEGATRQRRSLMGGGLIR
jgi:hypothetical protein